MFNGWLDGYMMGTRLQHWQYLGWNRLLENEPYAAIFASTAKKLRFPPHHSGLWFYQSHQIRKRGDSSQILHDILFADQADRNFTAVGIKRAISRRIF